MVDIEYNLLILKNKSICFFITNFILLTSILKSMDT